jgi:hypothetical protein
MRMGGESWLRFERNSLAARLAAMRAVASLKSPMVSVEDCGGDEQAVKSDRQ